VTVIEPRATEDEDVVVGDGSEPDVLARASLAGAVGFVAGTDNDTTNLSLVAAARRINPSLFVAARQNEPATAPLFEAMDLDALLVPTEVIAHQAYAQLSTPLLWRFLQELPGKGDAWAAELVDRLTELCGPQLQALWKIRLTRQEAPALVNWVDAGEARLGDLLRNPEDRDQPLHAVVLLVRRGRDAVAAPGPDFLLHGGDELLLAGWAAARRALATIAEVDAVREYVVTGRRVPTGWVWRRLRPEPRREKELTRRVG
jgi:Trk K+ transport system NAD-binding subunit